MSLTKIIIITVVSVLVLFVFLLVYALWPRIRNVSHYTTLKPLVNKPLALQSEAYIFYCHEGDYRLIRNVLNDNPTYPCERKITLPAGSWITIHDFKTYTNSAGSGFTHLFAIGKVTLPLR